MNKDIVSEVIEKMGLGDMARLDDDDIVAAEAETAGRHGRQPGREAEGEHGHIEAEEVEEEHADSASHVGKRQRQHFPQR